MIVRIVFLSLEFLAGAKRLDGIRLQMDIDAELSIASGLGNFPCNIFHSIDQIKRVTQRFPIWSWSASCSRGHVLPHRMCF